MADAAGARTDHPARPVPLARKAHRERKEDQVPQAVLAEMATAAAPVLRVRKVMTEHKADKDPPVMQALVPSVDNEATLVSPVPKEHKVPPEAMAIKEPQAGTEIPVRKDLQGRPVQQAVPVSEDPTDNPVHGVNRARMLNTARVLIAPKPRPKPRPKRRPRPKPKPKPRRNPGPRTTISVEFVFHFRRFYPGNFNYAINTVHNILSIIYALDFGSFILFF